MAAINPYYLGAFIIYLIVVLGIGIWGYFKTSDVNDFWVYGKNLGPWLATGSLVANFVSAVSVVGFIGAVYGGGYYIITGTIFGLMVGVSGLYFVVHKIRELDHITFPDIIEELTGNPWARPISAVVLLGNAWVYLIMQLVGASLLVTAITGVSYTYMVWVIGFVFIAYTVLGGLVSVAWTDIIQGSLMVLMVFVAFFYMLFDLGGLTSINTQFAALSAANTMPLGGGALTIIGAAGSIVAFFGTIFTSQSTIVRINATRDIKTAKIHVAAGGVILSIFYVVLISLGGATTVALSNIGLDSLGNVDRAFPALITQYLPTGIGVVIILAVMSATLSTTDSRLHACGITTARDIYDFFADDPSDQRLLKVSRYATIFFGLTATIAAIDPPATIIGLYNFRAILLTSSLLIPIYITLYWRGIPGRAVLASIVLGTIFGVGTSLLGSGFMGIPATFIGVGVALVVLLAGNIIWKSEAKQSGETV